MIFRELAFEYAQLRPGIIELFADDGSLPTSRISQRGEQSLVSWLLSDISARRLLCEVLQRTPGAFVTSAIQQPFYAASEGDIDLLICDCDKAHEAAAIECKRLKVYVEDEGNDWVNRLDAVGEGVKQAKKLYDRFGFFQTYLAVISAVDGANRKRLNISSGGITA